MQGLERDPDHDRKKGASRDAGKRRGWRATHEPEDRHGDAEKGQKGRGVVDEGACSYRGKNPERHGNKDRHEQRENGEFQGGRKGICNEGADLAAQKDAPPEVALHRPPDIHTELNGEGSVEPEKAGDACAVLFRPLRPGEDDGGVAGHEPERQEDDKQDAQDDREK